MGPVLAIDTATPYLVLGTQNQERAIRMGRRHAELIFSELEVFMQACGLQPRELSAVVVGQGPGSYTGIRIGIAAALGISQGLNIPVVGVDTLAAIAARQRGEVTAVLSAPKSQVYSACYAVGDELETLEPPSARSAQEIVSQGCLLWDWPPSGQALATLGIQALQKGATGILPIYL
jgi:tRNA threonylcarbamoyl adenosine modification protein YeaZ